jgi:hypothetical protein
MAPIMGVGTKESARTGFHATKKKATETYSTFSELLGRQASAGGPAASKTAKKRKANDEDLAADAMAGDEKETTTTSKKTQPPKKVKTGTPPDAGQV